MIRAALGLLALVVTTPSPGTEAIEREHAPPWIARDAAYREHAGKPPRWTGDGFALGDSYHGPDEVEALLRGYHERYPSITSLVEIGRTHQGRAILALKISDNPEVAEDEPAVLFDGGHHTELLAIEYVLDAIDRTLAGYGRDPQTTRRVDGLELWCVPVVNVDGLARFMHETGTAQRKNARDSNGNGVLDLHEGVDINRNYPFAWGEEGSSAAARNLRYHGPAPGSEPETRAMMQLAYREHFAAVLSFHTHGTHVYTSYLAPTRRDLSPDIAAAIGAEIAAVAPVQPNGRSYYAREGPEGVDVAGSAQDWHLFAHGSMAFTIEGSHHAPAREIRDVAVEGTRPIWIAMLDRVLDGPWIGGHVRDADGAPVVVEVMIAEIETFEGESWKSRARDGRFDRAVAEPGTYTLVVRIDGREPVLREVEVGSQRVDVDITVR